MRYFLFLVFCISMLFANEPQWQEDYQTAVLMAKKAQKPIYVFISAAECPWCAKFEKEVLSRLDIISILDKYYISVHLVRDFDTIPKKFKTRPVPRHYFLDKNGKILFQDLGYKKPNTFEEELSLVLKEIDK
ncbi:MAG: thioredoxin family protein [Epsilonproteobacteria bacterium]|nr:thioredoxin family protein [Campylobacterota bacterium]